MKKLDSYLIVHAIKYLLITELAGLVMFTSIEFFEHMDLFTSSFKNFILSIGYILFQLPYYLNLILPLSFLISMLVLLILMVRGNEIITLRTSGISTLSIMKPFLYLSGVLVILSFILSEAIVPQASYAAEYIYRIKIKQEEPYVFFKNDSIWFKRNNTINSIDYFDTKQNVIKGLTVLELSPEYLVTKRTDAREGVWNNNEWVFKDVEERTFGANGVIKKQKYKQLKNIMSEQPAVFKVVDKTPEEMSYRELSRYIDKLKRDGHNTRRYLVDLYNKIAFPFINIIMVLAAFSVGLRYTKTRHISRGIFLGISLGVFYWFFHSVSLSFGYSEIFPPLFAAWFANLLFLSFGIIGIISLRT